ncbi:MAG: TadE/TadG family type IV pilus assembly protein [Dehalococcoidia bacterium]
MTNLTHITATEGDEILERQGRKPRPWRASRRLGRFARRERGQNIVEFAIMAPLLFLLVFGIIDFGIGLHSWITVTNAAREGARLGAVHASEAEIIAKVEESAHNVDPADLDITVTNEDPDGLSTGEPVTVEVAYEYTLMTPLSAMLQIPSFNIVSTAEMRLE